jgi:hypothetical protein
VQCSLKGSILFLELVDLFIFGGAAKLRWGVARSACWAWQWAQKDGCAQRTGSHAWPKPTSILYSPLDTTLLHRRNWLSRSSNSILFLTGRRLSSCPAGIGQWLSINPSIRSIQIGRANPHPPLRVKRSNIILFSRMKMHKFNIVQAAAHRYLFTVEKLYCTNS